jgi:histone H3/H4
MNLITKPSITRIARKSGVKSMSDDCYPVIQECLKNMVTEIIKTALIINSENNTKTLMTEDVYKAIRMNGYNIAQSSELGTNGINGR